ncbi:E3 ubiquitin-protein ligase FANCL-like [Physella acuta]|uniref:E3 ubiquitin-protein ligase FANCL-like n=1 Tax=Physella acuta TaxID=109671 RepID=UPI0027DCAB6E|nr:E3 ubiquitin-protein ligase FANCL-like [Physella acuta]
MSNLKVAPLLIPLHVSNEHVKYYGFLNILGHSYRLGITVPLEEGVPGARLECEWSLHHRLQHKYSYIQQILRQNKSLDAFLQDFIQIAESCVKDYSIQPESWSQYSSVILQQIQEIGWSRLVSLDDSFSVIELSLLDPADRRHTIKIMLNKKDPTAAPQCETLLPEKFSFTWSGKTLLKHVFQEFETAVNGYQQFWDTMKELDDKCWVLEPEQPTLATAHRRIALGPNISIQITVNCHQPSTFPECRLLGALSSTAELREKLNVNLHRWDPERSLLKNLQEVLDMEFPSHIDTKKEELSVDCGICYCPYQGEETPDIVCEDKRCAHVFHRICLYEWLRNLSARQSFNTLFGECPFCGHAIRVKISAG